MWGDLKAFSRGNKKALLVLITGLLEFVFYAVLY